MVESKPLAIDLHNLGVMREQRWILREVNWHVPSGSYAAILGPNGSGKSTLARVLAAHLWPTSGECRILGEHFGDISLPDLRHRIRLVQPAGPFDVDSTMTSIEVVLSGFFASLALYDPVTDAMREEALSALAQVGLSHVADHIYS